MWQCGLVPVPREKIVLASGSPRRRELLSMIGLSFEVAVPSVDEAFRPRADPARFVTELAMRKAVSVAAGFPGALLIGADTVVVLDGRILGKPADGEHAASMLRDLSGRTHTVYTGVALLDTQTGLKAAASEESLVTMKQLTDGEISTYVGTGEPLDKAGSYGIQGIGSVFIREIKGCFFNVMGLPVGRLYDMLAELSAQLGEEKRDK